MRMASPCAACSFATCKFPNLKKKIIGPPFPNPGDAPDGGLIFLMGGLFLLVGGLFLLLGALFSLYGPFLYVGAFFWGLSFLVNISAGAHEL